MPTVKRFLLVPLALLVAGCPAHEGPIDVVLVDIAYEETVIAWAEAGSDTFEVCSNGTTDVDAVVGCGPYGVGDPGDYVVRVTWNEVSVDKDVTLEKDNDYQANTTVTFEAAEFE